MKKINLLVALCLIGRLTNAQNPLWVSPSSNHNWVGINNTSTNNRLEITTSTGDPWFGLSGGSSGLRFTNLTTSSTPIANPGTGLLSVDSSGDVIYVTAPTGSLSSAYNGLSIDSGSVQLGGDCGSASAAALINNREVPMAGYNMNWTMPASSPSEYLIGLSTCTTTVTRFGVFNDYYRYSGYFQNTYNSSSGTIGVIATVTNTTGKATGIRGAVSGATGYQAFGGEFASQGSVSAENIAANCNASNGTTFSIAGNLDCQNSSSPLNIGHQTDINSGTNSSAYNYGSQILINNQGTANFGTYCSVLGATNNYGVYAYVANNSGSTGAGTPPGPDYAGFFDGDVYISNMYGISDKRLKKNISSIQSSIDIIKKLKPVTYSFDQQSHPNLSLAKGKQYGFIAQEVQEVLPELTAPIVFPAKLDENGKQLAPKEEYIGINYQGFTAILFDAVKQQQTTIENQQQQIDELKAMIQAQANTTNARQSVQLSDIKSVVLNQNVPNPFAEQTIITYNVPQDANQAQILFYDQNGRLIQSSTLTTKGIGYLTVFANDLSNGSYNYTLVIDGKIIDTKKMIKQ